MTDYFELMLCRAISGSHRDLEAILTMYEPLIQKYSFINSKFDEDLHQYIMIHIALNISKFTI